MYECVSLNKKNMDSFKELNFNKWKFNKANEDFLEYYSNSNFAQQLISRRRVKLIKQGEKYIGFIWYEPLNKYFFIIKAMFSTETSTQCYSILTNCIKGKGVFRYKCEKNDYNFSILEELGFEKKDGIIELYLNHFEINNCEEFMGKNNLSFRQFRRGIDENLRCRIQNEVFKDKDRIPLSINDIYLEESQNYYFEKGAVFLYKGDNCVGYGQIILEKNIPYIVNVGVLKEFQGLKYGRILMYHLLNIIKEGEFQEAGIRVKSNNLKALSLYKNLGFIEKKEVFNWELKKSSG